MNQNKNIVKAVGHELHARGYTRRPDEQFSAILRASIYGFVGRRIRWDLSTGLGDSCGNNQQFLVIDLRQHRVAEWYNILAVRMLVAEGRDTDYADGMAQSPLQAVEYLPPTFRKSPIERHELEARHSAIKRLLFDHKSRLDNEKDSLESILLPEISEKLRWLVHQGAENAEVKDEGFVETTKQVQEKMLSSLQYPAFRAGIEWLQMFDVHFLGRNSIPEVMVPRRMEIGSCIFVFA